VRAVLKTDEDIAAYRELTALAIYFVDVARAVGKYGERGLLFSCCEVGSMYQAVEQEGARRNWGSRLWGGFSPYELCALVGLHPTRMIPIVVQLVGQADPSLGDA
jgi:hypothetical protein